MQQDFHTWISENPKFQELVRSRSRFAWTLSWIMLLIYQGFILLVAFAKGFLAMRYRGLATANLSRTEAHTNERTSSRRASSAPDLIAAASAASSATPRRSSRSRCAACCELPSASSRSTIANTLIATARVVLQASVGRRDDLVLQPLAHSLDELRH